MALPGPRRASIRCCSGLARIDVDKSAISSRTREAYRPSGLRKERVIAPASHVVSWMKLRSTLTDDDASGLDELSSEGFHTEHLRIGIAAVLSGAYAFLVCHNNQEILFSIDRCGGDELKGQARSLRRSIPSLPSSPRSPWSCPPSSQTSQPSFQNPSQLSCRPPPGR